MIGCLRTRARKQPIIVLYFESELVLKFYNFEARSKFLTFLLEKSQPQVVLVRVYQNGIQFWGRRE